MANFALKMREFPGRKPVTQKGKVHLRNGEEIPQNYTSCNTMLNMFLMLTFAVDYADIYLNKT